VHAVAVPKAAVDPLLELGVGEHGRVGGFVAGVEDADALTETPVEHVRSGPHLLEHPIGAAQQLKQRFIYRAADCARLVLEDPIVLFFGQQLLLELALRQQLGEERATLRPRASPSTYSFVKGRLQVPEPE